MSFANDQRAEATLLIDFSQYAVQQQTRIWYMMTH